MNPSNKNEEVRLKWFGIPKILPYLRPYRHVFARMIPLGALTTAIEAAYPLFNRYALIHFVGERTLQGMPLFLAAYLGLFAFHVLINFISTYDCGKMEVTINRELRGAAFRHLQTLSFSYYNQNSVGYIHARVMSDTGMIGELFSWELMDFVWSGAYLLGILVTMFILHPPLALLIFILLPIASILLIYFQKKLVFYNRRIREANATITGDYNEGITGGKSIKALHIEESMKEGFFRDTMTMRKEAVRESHFSSLFISTMVFTSSLVLALVLWRGGSLTKEGLMQIGTLSVFMSYALEMLDPIQNMIRTVSAAVATQVNIERFTRLMGERSEVFDTEDVIEKYGDSFHPKRENWEALHGDIEFCDVSFQYPDGDELVLSHFDLNVPRGTNVAIVGETGAGKSTLVNLVCRFFEPTEGEIRIDGRPVKERSLLWLHQNLGYVLQTPHLFSGSIRDNLRYGKPEASDEEIKKALDLVSAADLLEKLPDGLDSDVGEGGELLSTGEKQLLSFARAILADPKILILDEATSSIDTVTEKKIQDAIRTVIKGRTSFVIAHRLSTIVDADQILVVHDGKIVESGTHRQLLKKKGAYFRLYQKQYEELLWNEG